MNARATEVVKCLVVDDLDDNLLTLSALLRADDVEVLTARSGSEALELLLVNDVALALLDVQMPQMDGFELAELIRGSERTRHIPLIFVTAGGHEPHRMFKGYEAGAVDFLFKPIDLRILHNKAAVFFELYRSRQRLAQELRERTETLRLNEMLTAVLAHDLRDPLNAMLVSARLIEQESDSERVRAAALRLTASGRSMNRLIADVLDLARARLAGGIPLQREPCDLRPAIERVIDEQRALQPTRRINVRCDGDLHGVWDAGRLGQVLSNLIANALQHGAADGTVDIAIDGSAADAIVIRVISAGSIAPHLLADIFDPFRGSSVRGAQAGLGLGLYIVKQIVQAHQGSVSADCDDPALTVFEVRIARDAGAPPRVL